MIFFTSNNKYLHKVDKIYVNMKNRKVLITDKKLEIKLFPFNRVKLPFDWCCLRVDKNTIDIFKEIIRREKKNN